MKTILIYMFIALYAVSILAQNIKVDKFVFASSAKTAQNDNFKFFNTVGQNAAGKFIYNSSKVFSGFWEIMKTISNIETKDFSIFNGNNIIKPNPATEYIEINLERYFIYFGNRISNDIMIINAFGECIITQVPANNK